MATTNLLCIHANCRKAGDIPSDHPPPAPTPQADQFRRLHPKEAAAECTRRTGIADMFPKTLIDDYVFDPCGYSMNGVHAAGFCTIHVTPEPECSYASCEASNWDPAKMDPAKLAEDCAGVFLPGKMTVALTTDADSGSAWDKHVLAFRPPAGYRPDGVTVQSLGCGGRVTFLRFTLADARLAAAVRPGSPKGIERVIRDTSAGIPAPLDVPVRDTDTPIYLPGEPPSFRPLDISCIGTVLISESVWLSLHLSSALVANRWTAGHVCAFRPKPLPSPRHHLSTPLPCAGSPIRNNSPKVQSPRAPAKALSDALQTLCGDNAAAVQRAIESLGAVDVLPSAEPAVMDEHLAKLVREHNLEDNFFVYDVGRLARSFACWNEAMPRVEPFYAVKCNPEPAIVAALTALGCGFDCASKAEVDLVLQLGAAPSRVIYANPCKKPSELRALASSGVDVTTFDSADELFKVKQLHPDCRVVLRIRADDPGK